MPIYEYECLSCGGLSEFIEGVSGEGADKVCSHCRSVSLKRVLSKGVTARMDGIIGDRGGKTCCGREDRCGSPPCSESGACCKLPVMSWPTSVSAGRMTDREQRLPVWVPAGHFRRGDRRNPEMEAVLNLC